MLSNLPMDQTQGGSAGVGLGSGVILHDAAINHSLNHDTIRAILARVSSISGSFTHGLVCKLWHRLALSSQQRVRVRPMAKLTHQQILDMVGQFSGLKALELQQASVLCLSDRVLSDIGRACQGLTTFSVGTYASFELPEISAEGLSRFVKSTSKLERCCLLQPHLEVTEYALPDDMPALASLHRLEVKGIHHLPKSFTALCSLRHLVLWNEASPEAPDQVLFQITSLTKLTLNFLAMEALPRSLSRLTNLVDLEIFSDFIQALPDDFPLLVRLRRLHLRCTSLLALPDTSHLRDLRRLELPACSTLVALPPSVTRLERLTFLDAGHTLHTLPGGLARLTSLLGLRISFIEEGEIFPSGLGSLTSLKSLAFECCGVLRELPNEISLLTNLESLTADLCIELESIPDWVGRLPRLRHMELSCLSKIRTLPASLAHSPFLASLVLISLDELCYIPEEILARQRLGSFSLAIRGCTMVRGGTYSGSWSAFSEGHDEAEDVASMSIDCPGTTLAAVQSSL